jgi:hypothetical protein
MAKSKSTTRVKAKGFMLLNLAVALYLFATGIMGITDRDGGGEIRAAVFTMNFEGDFARVLIVILSVLAIAAGIFLLIKLFGVSISNIETLLLILSITWLVFIVMIDIVPLLSKKVEFNLLWLKVFGSHAMVLAGISLGTERFGIK